MKPIPRFAIAALTIVMSATFAFAQDKQALIDRYDNAIEPKLQAAKKSESLLMDAMGAYWGWIQEIQIANHEGELFEEDDGLALLGEAFDNAIKTASANCAANRNPSEAENILSLYAMAQNQGLSLDNAGEMAARYNKCAHFRMVFRSVITTKARNDEIVSTVSGSVFLVPAALNGMVGQWEGDPGVLNHVSLTTTRKSPRRCKLTWGGENSLLAVPGATIDIPPSKYLSDRATTNRPEPTASLFLTIERVNEFLHTLCKDSKGRTVINLMSMAVNFEAFRSLHDDRWDRQSGYFKFGHDAGWVSVGDPYLVLGSNRKMLINRGQVSEQTLIEIFHMPKDFAG